MRKEVGLMAVTDEIVAAILDPAAGLALQVPVKWKERVSTVRAQMSVHNVHALPLFVGMQVTKDKPWKPTVYLMYENEHLRRLDINGSHTNRTADREQWTHRTHKHRWTEAHHDAAAYTPTDIPDIPLTAVTGSHLRDVFEAFLRECQIQTRGAYSWSDPNLATIMSGRLGVAG
jgi:hypothetical protein